MNLKKMSMITLSTALTLGTFTTSSYAASSTESVKVEQAVPVKDAASEQSKSRKAAMIKQINVLFGDQFANFTADDFRTSTIRTRPDQPKNVESYRLDVNKEVQAGKRIYGNFEFVGKDLQLFSFNFQPADKSAALFPPKVSEPAAAKIAEQFLEKARPNESYQFREDPLYYGGNTNTPLTEPIFYNFTAEKLHNGIPVRDQTIRITVLGNGDITGFYSSGFSNDETFTDTKPAITKEEALTKWRENLNVNMTYVVDYDYATDQRDVRLVYQEQPIIQSLSAIDGQWQIGNEFRTDIPKIDPVTLLTNDSGKNAKPITADEAKALAKELLPAEEDGAKRQIEDVRITERQQGVKVIDVQYMYRTARGGYGSSISFNQETGELLNFHQNNQFPEKAPKTDIGYEAGLQKAVRYIKKYAYARMDEYAYPEATATFDPYNQNEYTFTFPRIKNGIPVRNDNIRIGISKETGALTSLSSSYSDLKKWPDPKQAVSKDQALTDFKQKFAIELAYINENRLNRDEPARYKLVYVAAPSVRTSAYDALTGKWVNNQFEKPKQSEGKIKHPWAAKELNYMISANIIKVADLASFDPDQPLTKGEALEILSKSLTRIYQNYGPDQQKASPFTNIKPDHPLYDVIKQSVNLGIIDATKNRFNVDEALTREELAYWYVRALGLNEVAKKQDLFNYTFSDTAKMSDRYKGYIALANSFGLLTTNNLNQFSPKQKVTLAQLAIANLRLAKQVTELNAQRKYY